MIRGIDGTAVSRRNDGINGGKGDFSPFLRFLLLFDNTGCFQRLHVDITPTFNCTGQASLQHSETRLLPALLCMLVSLA